MKNLTKQDVLSVAVALMNANGSTTSLDVKNQLRADDFNARQQEVGEFMRELQIEQNWDKNSTGLYNVYSVAAPSTSTSSTSNSIVDDCVNFINETIGGGIDQDLHPLGKNPLPSDPTDLMKLAIAIDAIFGTSVRDAAYQKTFNYTTISDIGKYVANEMAMTPTLLSNLNGNQSVPSSSASTASNSTKTRRKRMVINDSATPSKSNRVTINIDPKADPFDPSVTSVNGNDWFVRPVNFSNVSGSTAIFDQRYSSDNVRTAFARLFNVDFATVRAARVKHVKIPAVVTNFPAIK